MNQQQARDLAMRFRIQLGADALDVVNATPEAVALRLRLQRMGCANVTIEDCEKMLAERKVQSND
jgi:hypothetical protein